jgi:hypothetical protein
LSAAGRQKTGLSAPSPRNCPCNSSGLSAAIPGAARGLFVCETAFNGLLRRKNNHTLYDAILCQTENPGTDSRIFRILLLESCPETEVSKQLYYCQRNAG